MIYSSIEDTKRHIEVVGNNLKLIIFHLRKRMETHDLSKMEAPEVQAFNEYTPKLADSTYGSEEYKGFLSELKPALDHHYATNRHHPEHFQEGIRGMNLVDIVEMFCDWYAATLRHNNGNIIRSIEINQERFNYSDDLKAILENTYRDIFEDGQTAEIGGQNERD
jgi:hypothetical protein